MVLPSDLGGGMERVVFKSKTARPTNGKMFMYVSVLKQDKW